MNKLSRRAGAILSVSVMSLAAGCMTSTVKAPVEWSVECTAEVAVSRAKPRHGVAKLTLVEMRAPYAVREVAVLRADGSVAFDPCNSYAAAPVQLMKGVAAESLAACGLFESVVSSGSSVDADVEVEVVVKRLALDCRQEGSRRAVAELFVRLVRSHRIVAEAPGAGAADAAKGDYAAAFSEAATTAFADALKRLSNGTP